MLSAAPRLAVLRPQEDGDHLKSTHAYLANAEEGNIYALYNSPEFHDWIRSAFAFKGYDGDHQSGLGLAILYPHDELNPNGILAAAIENFAPAIMNGTLTLDVDCRVLDASSIEEIALDVSKHLNDEAVRANVARYLNLVRLAQDEAAPYKIKLSNARKGDLEPMRKTAAIKALQKQIANGDDVVLEIAFPLVRNGIEKEVTLRAAIGETVPGQPPDAQADRADARDSGVVPEGRPLRACPHLARELQLAHALGHLQGAVLLSGSGGA